MVMRVPLRKVYNPSVHKDSSGIAGGFLLSSFLRIFFRALSSDKSLIFHMEQRLDAVFIYREI